MCVCVGGGEGEVRGRCGRGVVLVGGGSKKLTLSFLVLREFWRQNFAYFFHLHNAQVEKLQLKVNYPSAPKRNTKFEILIVKIFSLKQKSNKIAATLQKINFCVSKGTALFFLKAKISSFV